jgi:hypothetical protein
VLDQINNAWQIGQAVKWMARNSHKWQPFTKTPNGSM